MARIAQEIGYGIRAGRMIASHEPSVAVLSNIPLLSHALVAWQLKRRRTPMIFWQQDIYSVAIGTSARKRLPLLGGLVARTAEAVERQIARWSGSIVAIAPNFMEKLAEWGVAEKAAVIPNWAPIEEIGTHPRENEWSTGMGFSSAPLLLYSGTLGLKHDPSILAMIAEELSNEYPDASMVVISEGLGREWLEEWKRSKGADNLLLLDFLPYEEMPLVLASADLLIAILEPEASKYSVPSKVLTYMCSERPILAVMPSDNSVAGILTDNDAGVVVDPRDRETIRASMLALLSDADRRNDLGRAGRRYAEAAFSPERAADRFEALFERWLNPGPSRLGRPRSRWLRAAE
jgi:glycosyltransferase involved in cell wall biosynthesis